MQYNIIKDFMRDVKAFRVMEVDPLNPSKMRVSESFSQMMRFAALYSLIPGLIGMVTDFDVGGVMSAFGISPFEEDRKGKGDRTQSTGLIENPMIEESSKLLEYMSNAPDGDLNEQLKHYGAYYGKNPITANLGPFVSDTLMAAELTDFLNLTGSEYEEHRSLNYDPNDSDWWYNVARIFNIQGARTFWKTIPAALKGQWEKVFRMETGMYKPKWFTKTRDKLVGKLAKATYGQTDVLPDINIGYTRSEDSAKKKRLNRRALASLSNINETMVR